MFLTGLATMSQEARARTAAYVKARRGRLGLRSQRKLAELAGVDTKTINSLETGRRWPQPAILAQIEQALGLKEGSLQAIHDGGEPTPLDEAEPPPGQASADSDDPVAQIRAIEGLDDDERDLIALFVAQMLKARRTPTDTNAQRGRRGSEGRKGA
jgi:transcriptional regulator with XRE-family HTH domain